MVADVHLIVEILALQEEELQVELRSKVAKRRVQLAHCVEIEQRAVERPYHIVAYPASVFGLNGEANAFEHVTRELSACRQSSHHLI